jgi:formylglycine-generating enzyme required for sulfatase activity
LVPLEGPRIAPSIPETAGTPPTAIPRVVEEGKEISPTLSALWGKIQVVSRPAGASVFVNGADTGMTTPMTDFAVAPGPLTVEVKLGGYRRGRQTREIPPDGKGKFDFTLQERKSYTNSLGMEFVPVEGLPETLFSIYETRVKDFRQFAGDGANNDDYNYRDGGKPFILKSDGWKTRGWDFGWDNPGFAQDGDHPVTCVSWEDANGFCRWLTRKEGLERQGLQYRLPTDREWSVAVGLTEEDPARSPEEKDGKTTGVYPWGREFSAGSIRGNYAGEEARDGDWPQDWFVREGFRDGYPRTAPVEESVENVQGLNGMGGNVWEWCEDAYHAPAGSENAARVLRGGSWSNFDQMLLLSSCRGSAPPGYRYGLCGFRCVLASRERGKGIFEKCPRCGRDTRAWDKNCGFCGTDIIGYREFLNRLAEGKRYLEERYEAEATALKELLKILPEDREASVRLEEIPAEIKRKEAEALVGKGRESLERKDYQGALRYGRAALALRAENEDARRLIDEASKSVGRAQRKAALGAMVMLAGVGAVIAAFLLANGKKEYDAALERAGEWEKASDWSRVAQAARAALDAGWPFRSQAQARLARAEAHLAYAVSREEFEAKLAAQSEFLEKYGGEGWRRLLAQETIGRDAASQPLQGAEAYRQALAQFPGVVAEAELARAKEDYETALSLALASENQGRWVEAVAAADRAIGTGWPERSEAEKVLDRMRDKVPVRFGAPGRNSLGMEFVPVEGLPSVLFSKWPTRVKDYHEFVKATGYHVPECADWGKAFWNTWRRGEPPAGYGDHPVVGVSWEDAHRFCDWLTRKEGTDRMGLRYRLPTDREWSLAVGLAGEDPAAAEEEKDARILNVYPWDRGKGTWPPPRGAGNYSPALKVDDDALTSPAGKYGEQANGLCDLGGNVWEWCEDAYHESGGSDNADRVLRGGSWLSRGRAHLLSAARDGVHPAGREADFGFRCVLAPAG